MSLVKIFMSVMIGAIFGVGIAIPVIAQVIANGSLTGIDAVLAGFISTLIMALLVYAVASQF